MSTRFHALALASTVTLAVIAVKFGAARLAARDVLADVLTSANLGIVGALAGLLAARVFLVMLVPAWMVFILARSAFPRRRLGPPEPPPPPCGFRVDSEGGPGPNG